MSALVHTKLALLLLSALYYSILTVAMAHSSSKNFSLAGIFSNGMVLQRDSTKTLIWGLGELNSTVKTLFLGKSLVADVDSVGVWRQRLPATPSGGPISLVFLSRGKKLVLDNVYFGDVFLCR